MHRHSFFKTIREAIKESSKQAMTAGGIAAFAKVSENAIVKNFCRAGSPTPEMENLAAKSTEVLHTPKK